MGRLRSSLLCLDLGPEIRSTDKERISRLSNVDKHREAIGHTGQAFFAPELRLVLDSLVSGKAVRSDQSVAAWRLHPFYSVLPISHSITYCYCGLLFWQ